MERRTTMRQIDIAANFFADQPAASFSSVAMSIFCVGMNEL